MVPCQDTPRLRVTYDAEVDGPRGALGRDVGRPRRRARPGARPGTRTFRFEMPQPIPPYLLALAVGELESRDLVAAVARLGRARDGRRRPPEEFAESRR